MMAAAVAVVGGVMELVMKAASFVGVDRGCKMPM